LAGILHPAIKIRPGGMMWLVIFSMVIVMVVLMGLLMDVPVTMAHRMEKNAHVCIPSAINTPTPA
jgi:hypothetical protein